MAVQPRKTLSNSLVSCTSFTGALCILLAATSANAEISQSPLLLGGGNVPGNLALVPSVEWPTILSMANLGAYKNTNEYVGYFDPDKCYSYNHDSVNNDRRNSHFYPSSLATNRNCVGSLWSGNFLNWATTPTIDPFRSALTGGYRVKDTPQETILEKARHTGQNTEGTRNISNNTVVDNATPAVWSTFNTRLYGLGAIMRFTKDGDLTGNAQAYTPTTVLKTTPVYEVYIRVKVCDASVGLEANCKPYSQGYKPEGLIQQYANDIRYSVFGYLNDHDMLRDGGVLRAQQKFVGQTVRTPGVAGVQSNGEREWDPLTGTLVQNPNPTDATNTNASISDSGVINYLNKFGQMTSKNHKQHDPVSELFYTAIRYFKNQGNVPAYSTITGDATQKLQLADGFPVITDWHDPMQYACQKNVILGIGDANTHRDKNLPGSTRTVDEPTKPGEVTADTTVDVLTATAKVAELEGITIGTPFTGRENSAYMAGLAYDAHTVDQRPDLAGEQTVSTYWVDVREKEVLLAKEKNQYWLAAKYGGFKVPSDVEYGDPYTRTAALPETWWYTTGETLATNYKRPDNFYVASDASKMIESLKSAFAQIANEVKSTTTSLATNATKLDSNASVYQTWFDSGTWQGDLEAKSVETSEGIGSTAIWSAAAKLDALAEVSTRKIFTANAFTPSSDTTYATTTSGADFTWAALDATGKAALKLVANNGTPVSDTVAEARVDYLRGDRTQEKSEEAPFNPFRKRGSRLGDIINSDPLYIYQQDYGYSLLRGANWPSAGDEYLAFRTSSAYQARLPLVVVGANDGMLHGFDASIPSGGAELFAYVPRGVISDLYRLTESIYAHRYYVDGTPQTSDVWINNSWKTIVVGATGAGGNSIFALDVTDPSSMTSSKVMWEFTAPDMGRPLYQPTIVPLANGKFGVIISSGHSDAAVEHGHVWVLDAENGAVLKKFTVDTAGGMGKPLASDINNDRIADRIYTGDSAGNLWRFDITAATPSDWDAPNTLKAGAAITPLFIAKDDLDRAQPITAPLSATINQEGKQIILFGTGSFQHTTDTDLAANQRVESFYGIIDADGTAITARSELQEQKILDEYEHTTNVDGNLIESGRKGRTLTNNTINSPKKGWYLDLLWKEAEGGSDTITGERVISGSILRKGAVVFTTMTPSDDPCGGNATSWIMALDVFNGGRLTIHYFDMNDDGKLDDNDGHGDEFTPSSGISGDGVIEKPTFIENDAETCEGDDCDPLICFVGSSSEPVCMPAPPGSNNSSRISWREIR